MSDYGQTEQLSSEAQPAADNCFGPQADPPRHFMTQLSGTGPQSSADSWDLIASHTESNVPTGTLLSRKLVDNGLDKTTNLL